jgi:hypothetical protein
MESGTTALLASCTCFRSALKSKLERIERDALSAASYEGDVTAPANEAVCPDSNATMILPSRVLQAGGSTVGTSDSAGNNDIGTGGDIQHEKIGGPATN